jgi:hypothetical protein
MSPISRVKKGSFGILMIDMTHIPPVAAGDRDQGWIGSSFVVIGTSISCFSLLLAHMTMVSELMIGI